MSAIPVLAPTVTQLATPRQAIRVEVISDEPLMRAGLRAELESSGMNVLEDGDSTADVVLLVTRRVDEDVQRRLREIRRARRLPVVLISSEIDDQSLLAAVEAGACALIRQTEATSEGLRDAVHAARKGDGSMPPDLLGRLMTHVTRLHEQVLQPNGLHLHGMSDREVEVLRLVANGQTTSEIAAVLAYSERTIKNILHDVTTRLQLRNRSHAVAYAVRHGLI